MYQYEQIGIVGNAGGISGVKTNRLSFPNDDALKKAVFLALGEIERKWTMPVRDWGLIMNQFICIFDKRVQI